MKAIVMAGGEGSRLRPLTLHRPKPMVTIVNRPVMEHVLGLLRRHGVTEIIVTLQYLASVIQEHFGDGSSLGLDITYVVEAEPLGTAGSVRAIIDQIDDTFLVVSADALTDLDLTSAVDKHRTSGALGTLVLHSVPNPEEYGVVVTDQTGRVQSFLEKPRRDEVFSDLVNTGIYILEPSIFDGIPEQAPLDFSHDVFPPLLARGAPLYGHTVTGYWCDVGTLAEYRKACADVLSGRVDVGGLGQHIGGGIWCGTGDIEIAPDAQLFGPIYLGDAVKVKGGVVIHGPSVLEDDTIVDDRARVERSVVGRHTYVGERVTLRGAITGRHCSIKSRSVLYDGVVVGDRSNIGDGAVVQPNLRIWPNKDIEPGATVTQSLVWGSQGRKALFGRWGITGLANIEITPEFAARLGGAYGATLERGATVTMNRDPHHTSRMIKRALISGIPSAGVHVLDLKSVPIPVARFITRASDTAGGIHVRLSPFDNRVVDLKFFGSDGLDLPRSAERAIENTFFREDFRRAYLDEVGTISESPEMLLRYEGEVLAALDRPAIAGTATGQQWVIDYGHSPVALILPGILRQLGLSEIGSNADFEYRTSLRYDLEFDQGMHQLSGLVRRHRAPLGIRFELGGEKIFLVDGTGSALPGWTALGVVAQLTLASAGGGTIVVPVTAPSMFDRLADAHSGRVVRTRTTPAALMALAQEPEVVLAGDGLGGFIFPSYAPYFDGLYAAVRIVKMVGLVGVELEVLARDLPAFTEGRREIPCPWDAKARILRRLSERLGNGFSPLYEGIRTGRDDEWVLVLPDPDRPAFLVVAEASTHEMVDHLLDRYSELIGELEES
ncbi:MAG: NTP transferase domain-containing protein [Chloroflexi bacterium]|nr:NTP transferase domain-containing protein [Chloroflexota bacterium]